MVWHGMNRLDAANHARLSEHSLYVALRRSHVKAYYLSELEVLRSSERARNIHALVEVRDQTSNQMARVQAVKALEQLDDEPPAAAHKQTLPGLVVVVMPAAQTQMKTVGSQQIDDASVTVGPAAVDHAGLAHD